MNKNQTVTLKIVHTGDFATFGQAIVAYVRKVDCDGNQVFSLHGADGEQLGIEPTEQQAMLAAQQMNLFPVVVQ